MIYGVLVKLIGKLPICIYAVTIGMANIISLKINGHFFEKSVTTAYIYVLCARRSNTSYIKIMGGKLIGFITLILLCFFASCTSTKPIFGTYKTNFADLGFFGTTLILKPDSTFNYTFSGDLIHDQGKGIFTVNRNRVFLNFIGSVSDSIESSDRFSLMPQLSVSEDNRIIVYKEALYIGHKKLFFAHATTGEKVSRASKYNKRKKYILWGTHYYKKRWFLRQFP